MDYTKILEDLLLDSGIVFEANSEIDQDGIKYVVFKVSTGLTYDTQFIFEKNSRKLVKIETVLCY